MVDGTMCRRMFGPLLMTQALPHEMIVMKMMKTFVLCVVKRTTTVCGQCNERYCAECIDPHTCGDEVVHVAP